MKRKTVHIKKAIQAGWKGTKANLGVLLGLSTLYLAIAFGSQAYLSGHEALSALSWVLQTLLAVVLMLACLRISRNEGAHVGKLSDLPLGPKLVLKFMAITLLTGAMAGSGFFVLGLGMAHLDLTWPQLLQEAQASPRSALALLGALGLACVPVVVLGLRFSFAPAFVLEEHCGIWASLGHSAKLADGLLGRLLLLLLALGGVLGLGLLCLGVGVVPAFVVTQLAWAWTYVDLHKQVFGAHKAK